jgi:hypothetical protein
MRKTSTCVPYQDDFPKKRFLFNICISETYDIKSRSTCRQLWRRTVDEYIGSKKFLWMAYGDLLYERTPSSDLGLASLHARYYSVLSRALYPSLRVACHDNHFLSSIDENFSGYENIIEAIRDCIKYAIQNIIVFDGVAPAHRTVRSNVVSTLHG